MPFMPFVCGMILAFFILWKKRSISSVIAIVMAGVASCLFVLVMQWPASSLLSFGAQIALVTGVATAAAWLAQRFISRQRTDQVQAFYTEANAVYLRKLVFQRSFRPTIMVIEGQGRAHQGFELVEVLGMDNRGYVSLVQSQIRATDEGGSYLPLEEVSVTIRYVRIGELQDEEWNAIPHEIIVWRPTPDDKKRALLQIKNADGHIQYVRGQY